MVLAGLANSACWWILVLRLKRIPRPAGYKITILRRYKRKLSTEFTHHNPTDLLNNFLWKPCLLGLDCSRA